MKLCEKHHARIFNPKTDIHFEETKCPKEGVEGEERDCYRVIIILDGWNHMEPIDEEEIEHYFSDIKRQRPKPFHEMERSEFRHFIDLVETDSDQEEDKGDDDP
jgi:hypothetical protein